MITPASLTLVAALVGSIADATYATTCSWSAGTPTDIYGTGMDSGTYKADLASCEAHCSQTSGCQAAQFSLTQRYNNLNCFIYNTKNDHNPLAPAINQFLLYKCTRVAQPHCTGDWCGPYLQDIYGTGLDGGTSQWSWQSCKSHCMQNSQCKAAQYSRDQNYNGLNCFLYDNQNPTEGQLKNFQLWYYNGHNSNWGPALAKDIPGVGLGGSWAPDLTACKARCRASNTCHAAQYSTVSQFHGFNCFIYPTDVATADQFMDFFIYKYDRAGCNGDSWCSRRLSSADDDKWVEVRKPNSIMV